MKFLAIPTLLLSVASMAQVNSITRVEMQQPLPVTNNIMQTTPAPGIKAGADIRIDKSRRWKLTGNKILTGSLVFLGGASKGFNEALQFQYKGFESIFPKANDQWFYPPMSFKNKYKDGDPAKGPRFPFSTSALVMLTDQYHLNNFIQRASITAALVVNIGSGKKPFKHYLMDAVYYTACYQLGFHSIYTPIRNRNTQ